MKMPIANPNRSDQSFARRLLRSLLLVFSGKLLTILSLEIAAKQSKYRESLLQELGRGVRIAPSAVIISPPRVSFGDDCCVNEYVHILGSGGVTCGRGVYIANHASIVSTTHPVDVEFIGDHPLIEQAVTIEDRVWIGCHAVILPGVTLGRSSVIAAGAVVTGDVPPYSVVAGVPAKVIRYKNLKEQDKQASELGSGIGKSGSTYEQS